MKAVKQKAVKQKAVKLATMNIGRFIRLKFLRGSLKTDDVREELQKCNSIYEVCFAFRVFIHKHNDYITTSAPTMAWK